MVDIGCDEPQVRGKLALYVDGRISGSEQWVVEEHLAHCPECLRDSEILGESALALAVLTPAERQSVVTEFGVAPAVVVAAPRPSSRDDAISRPPSRAPGSTGPGSSGPGSSGPGSSGPGSTGPRSAHPGGRLRRQPLVTAAAGLVVLVMLATGVGLGWSMLSGPDSSVLMVADSEGSANGAVLSVTVSQDGGDAAVRATVSGLRAGGSYRFYITDVAGTGYDMAGLTGSEQAQDVTTGCPVPLDRLDRFSVTAADGALVVAAAVRREGAAPTPTG